MDTTNLLRLLTPDVAQYWKTLYGGTVAAGVPDLVLFLSVALLALGAFFVVPEMIVAGSLQPVAGKLVRIFVASVAVSAAPSIMGKTSAGYQADKATFWQIYHSVYRGIYEGEDSFYAKWLYGDANRKGPVREAIAKLDEALKILAERRVAIEASLFAVEGVIGAIPGAREVCEGKLGVLPRGLKAGLVAALCRAAEMGKSALEDVARIYGTATRNLFVAVMTLLGVHSAIIYASVIMTYVLTFFLPLAAALFLYRPTEQAFPSLLGFSIGVYLVLILSAVGFGASSVVLFNTVAARVENALPEDPALAQIKEEAERVAKEFQRNYGIVMGRDSDFATQISNWKVFARTVTEHGQWDQNSGTVTGIGYLPHLSPFTDPRQYRVYKVDSGGNLVYQDGWCDVPGLAPAQGLYYYSFSGDPAELSACIAELEAARAENLKAAEYFGRELTGTIEKLVNTMVARLRDMLFTFTILAGAAIVLSVVLGMAMLWLIAFVGRVIGGRLSIGSPVGGKLPA